MLLLIGATGNASSETVSYCVISVLVIQVFVSLTRYYKTVHQEKSATYAVNDGQEAHNSDQNQQIKSSFDLHDHQNLRNVLPQPVNIKLPFEYSSGENSIKLDEQNEATNIETQKPEEITEVKLESSQQFPKSDISRLSRRSQNKFKLNSFTVKNSFKYNK